MNFIDFIISYGNVGPISIPMLIITLVISGFLSGLVVYSEAVSSKDIDDQYHIYLRTAILMSMGVSLIMLIVGNDLAKSFSLVGLLALTRFKSPSKGPGSHVFLFVSIAIGLACSLQYFVFALCFTAMAISTILMINFLIRERVGLEKEKKAKQEKKKEKKKKKKKEEKRQAHGDGGQGEDIKKEEGKNDDTL